MSRKIEHCHICEKSQSDIRCEHCDQVFCDNCSAGFNQFSSIDYNCCKVCAKYHLEDESDYYYNDQLKLLNHE